MSTDFAQIHFLTTLYYEKRSYMLNYGTIRVLNIKHFHTCSYE